MFKMYGGATKFKQWTQDNKLIMDELPIGADVMFYNDPNEDDPLITEVYEIRDEEDNVFRVCDVPNILLTKTEKIKVRIPKVVKGLYGNLYKAAGRNEMIFEVEPAEKPSDYVYEKTKINTIDPSRLPEGYPYKEADYAIGYEFRRLEVIGQDHKLYNDVNYVFGIIDNENHQLFALFLPNAESFPVGMKCKVVFDGTEYECEVKQYGEHSWYLGNLGIWYDTTEDTGEPFAIEWGEGGACITIPGKYLGGGNYEYHINELKVYIPSETIHPMSSDFLPTSVPAIESASVGQVPKVAAVDENGVPTKWEAGEAKSYSEESWTFTLEDGSTVTKKVAVGE